jgi:ABC-type glycerol-3-phosphate transport system substrate-binding protein
MSARTLLASLLTLSLLAACGRVPLTATPSPLPEPTATSTSPAPTPYAAPLVLRVWVTPRFDPASDSLLQARLDAFAAAHAELKIEVRVKDEASLLESLQLTAFAAPAVSPDLVTLSRADLEAAAAQGLIQPLDASLLDDAGWHPLARSLGHVGDSVYGLPFALDALVLASSAQEPFLDWQAVSDAGTIAFNVNDASFPLALYLSAGGELTDAQGNPALNETVLTRMLTLFAQGQVLPLKSDAEVASALGLGSAFAVGWANRFLNGGQAEVPMDALPGLLSPSATLVTSWNWSVMSADVEHQRLALELAEWLTADEFIGEWTPSLGFLPPRVAQRVRWKPVLDTARAIPPAELVNLVAPILSEAVASVLNGVLPEVAARAALERLK